MFSSFSCYHWCLPNPFGYSSCFDQRYGQTIWRRSNASSLIFARWWPQGACWAQPFVVVWLLTSANGFCQWNWAYKCWASSTFCWNSSLAHLVNHLVSLLAWVLLWALVAAETSRLFGTSHLASLFEFMGKYYSYNHLSCLRALPFLNSSSWEPDSKTTCFSQILYQTPTAHHLLASQPHQRSN